MIIYILQVYVLNNPFLTLLTSQRLQTSFDYSSMITFISIIIIAVCQKKPYHLATCNLITYLTSVYFHWLQIQCVDISPGGALGVSSGGDGELRVWHAASGKIRV